MAETILTFNGIDGDSGDYLLNPMPAEAIGKIVRGETLDEKEPHFKELKQRIDSKQAQYTAKEGVDPKDLSQAGWGVIFAFGADPAIREALS